ncbi:MAG: autotransporter-associated beta strand repeat-containing protein [Verrucomicrobiae bacterium]
MKTLKSLTSALAVAASFVLSPSVFSQQSGNWTSTAGGNWTDTANWTPAAVPGTAAGDAVNLNSNFTAGTKTIILNTNATVGTMIFGDGNSTSPSALILSGSSTLTFDNGASDATLTFQGSAASNTFNAPMLLAGNLTISGASMFPNFGGTVAAASAGLKTISYNSSAAYFQSTSVISDGAGQVAIAQTGSGALTLNGTNTFSGGVRFTRATLFLGNSSALGTGDLTLTNVGSITLSAAEGLSFSNNMTLAGASIGGGAGNITWTGNITQSAGSSINRVGRTDINGNVYLSANSTSGNTLVLGGTNNGDGSISGVISNWNGANGTAGTMNKIGNGTWTFSGANTYSGTTQVTGGTLIYGANQTIAATSVLNIKTVGTSTTATIDFAGFNATVNSVLFGGTAAAAGSANLLSTGSGTLTLGGSTAVTYSTASGTNPGTATISGKIDLGSGTRTFSVADSTQTTNELAITAAITDMSFG